MVNIEKLIDAAIDFRITTLKAKEQGIIHIADCGEKDEQFMLSNEKDFADIIEKRPYKIVTFSREYRYKYTTTISGLKFFCLANELLLPGDEDRL